MRTRIHRNVEKPPIEILYQDNHLIAINKKPKEIVQGDKTGDKPLSEVVAEYLARRLDKPGDAFIGVIHRLDRPASGVVIFAKTSKGLERMNEMFRDHEIKKTYWAVVKDRPAKDSDTLINYLYRDTDRNKALVYNEEVEGSQRAELDYKVIHSIDKYSLLEIDLKTGRHHQIRAQLAKIGCSIKGDLKYGFPRSNINSSIHLHARKVEFKHPIKLETITITANPPYDPVWAAFMKELFPKY
jgi:23S rRNA pseudouridine1911/1915/1917 synthase